MIKVYLNGKSFIEDNSAFLDLNKYMSSLFYIDSKLLNETNKTNYAIKVNIDDKTLLAIKVEPYNLLLYGDKECLEELLLFIKENDYEIDGIMCSIDIGDYLISKSTYLIDKEYYKSIGMDFMEARDFLEKSSSIVTIPSLSDVDAIYDLSINFLKDCGLLDKPNKDKIKNNISNYRIIRINDEIVSMASLSKETDNSYKISHVYTKPQYRGSGFARKIVNNIKNEILKMGKYATLNVDQKNPISNRLYASLGFKKVFSQGIYLVK